MTLFVGSLILLFLLGEVTYRIFKLHKVYWYSSSTNSGTQKLKVSILNLRVETENNRLIKTGSRKG